jgi:GTP-binding protein
LLHLVDIAPIDGADPAAVVKAIAKELESFSADLADKPRWLVINKIDLLDESDRAAARDKLIADLGWNGPVFEVSAATGEGTDALAQAIVRELEALQETGD